MKQQHIMKLLLGLLLLIGQTAWADGVRHVAFEEKFNSTEGSGGNDGQFSGTIASSKIQWDQEGWTSTKCGGAKQCLKFGTGDTDGVCTTPQIILLGKQGVLYFDAAGWASGQKSLTITANEGVTLSGETTFDLTASGWNTNYCIHFTLETATYLQLTFTGRRGFLDNIRVEEDVTAINAPTLPDEYLFWPNTTEEATTNITLVPSDSTTVYYTTDGTDPSEVNGKKATLTTNFKITGTTTVKARAYYQSVASELVSKTYTVGETIEMNEFKGINDGDEVRLFIPESSMGRMLLEKDGKAYIQTSHGAIRFDFGTTATFNPAPLFGQYVAGWIIGKKQTENGLLKLVATSNTNTDYLAMAEYGYSTPPPLAIVYDTNINEHIGDWVKADDMRYDGKRFTIEGAYIGALVDVSGIITAPNTITPYKIGGHSPLTFVIDENQEFIAPTTDIEHARVRLNRVLKPDQWNTFCIPFDHPLSYPFNNVQLCEYDMSEGTMMKFKEATSIEAGKPYLIKPKKRDIYNPEFDDVTLSATSANSIEDGGYAFIGTYNAKKLATDKTELFLTNSGQLAYPSSESVATIKGMRAFFQVPAGADACLFIDDEATPIGEIINGQRSMANNQNWYDLQGRKMLNDQSSMVNGLKKGIYITNGKKLLVK